VEHHDRQLGLNRTLLHAGPQQDRHPAQGQGPQGVRGQEGKARHRPPPDAQDAQGTAVNRKTQLSVDQQHERQRAEASRAHQRRKDPHRQGGKAN
jgi:hypothetical protein